MYVQGSNKAQDFHGFAQRRHFKQLYPKEANTIR